MNLGWFLECEEIGPNICCQCFGNSTFQKEELKGVFGRNLHWNHNYANCQTGLNRGVVHKNHLLFLSGLRCMYANITCLLITVVTALPFVYSSCWFMQALLTGERTEKLKFSRNEKLGALFCLRVNSDPQRSDSCITQAWSYHRLPFDSGLTWHVMGQKCFREMHYLHSILNSYPGDSWSLWKCNLWGFSCSVSVKVTDHYMTSNLENLPLNERLFGCSVK